MFKIFKFIMTRKKERLLFSILLLLLSIFWNSNSQGQLGERDSNIMTNAVALTMSFSTFLGGDQSENGNSIAVAPDGSCYVIGDTSSSNFPTLNAYNSTHGGYQDVFVMKFSSSGSLLWSTFLGGSSGEVGYDIAVTNDGNCYIIGGTESSNFPTLNAYNSTYGGGYGDTFVAKFSPSGALLWSTYLGGNDNDGGSSIAVTTDGKCYVMGRTYSSNFPTLNAYYNTHSGSSDAFVAKFNADGMLLWSTFLGGSELELTDGITTTSDGDCYVSGETYSSNFPLKNAYQNTFGGGNTDAFITKFATNGTLLWSTFLGGTLDDTAYSIAAVNNGDCYVTGFTWSSNFPTENAFDNILDGERDAFVTKLSADGSLLWSTFLGGSEWDHGSDIAVTSDDSCYVTGSTQSNDFPIAHAYDSTLASFYDDVFITKFSYNGNLLWGTFLGGNHIDMAYGIAITNNSKCFVTGKTYSSDFPTLNAYDNTLTGIDDAFVVKFAELEDNIAPTISGTSHYPLAPLDNETIAILADVTDSNGIFNVTVYYRVNSEPWINGEMEKGATINYYAVIGQFEANDNIKYYVEARDDSPNHNLAVDNNNTNYYSFIIEPSTPPSTSTTPHGISAYGFLTFIVVMPFIVFALRKRKK